MMSPEALGAAVSRLEREWGSHGYAIERAEEGPSWQSARIHVVHADGSRFTVAADRWGNPIDEGA